MNVMVQPSVSGAPEASLAGVRALVTGAGSGIGRAIAEEFSRRGATVGVHRRHAAAGADIEGETIALDGDLTDVAARARLVERFVAAAGGIDVLVNNAGGVPGYTPFGDVSDEALRTAFELNAVAPFRLIADAWPHMAAQGAGRIVNIGTVAVKYGGSPKGIHYVAAKGALDAMTTAFAKAGAAAGIRVNAIRCGVIDSGMHKKVPGYTDADFARRAALVPAGRAGRPEEIAALAAYLASPAADFITGQLIDVAGGD